MAIPARKPAIPKLDDSQLDMILEGFMPRREEMSKALRGLVESIVTEVFKTHMREITTEVKITGGLFPEKTTEGFFHKQFGDVMQSLTCGHTMLVGPAGSGKTTLAKQVAEAIGVPFYFNGAINSEYKLTGFINAQGQIVSTDFRKAYTTGGVYLFDEYDASLPAATMPFNSALSNGFMDFPDGRADQHPDFYCMAACNTFGRGADRVYVGRNQLDAASLDRFLTIDFEYDESLEHAIAGNGDWVTYVQKVRKAVGDLKLRHVVSPRASIMGAKLLAKGVDRKKVVDMVIWKGLDQDSRRNIEARVV
jgi:SpoVK/Ycf46/Vps4 family AAA+-type ATPase